MDEFFCNHHKAHYIQKSSYKYENLYNILAFFCNVKTIRKGGQGDRTYLSILHLDTNADSHNHLQFRCRLFLLPISTAIVYFLALLYYQLSLLLQGLVLNLSNTMNIPFWIRARQVVRTSRAFCFFPANFGSEYLLKASTSSSSSFPNFTVEQL